MDFKDFTSQHLSANDVYPKLVRKCRQYDTKKYKKRLLLLIFTLFSCKIGYCSRLNSDAKVFKSYQSKNDAWNVVTNAKQWKFNQ